MAWTEQLLVTTRHLEPSKLPSLIVLSNIGLSYDAWVSLDADYDPYYIYLIAIPLF